MRKLVMRCVAGIVLGALSIYGLFLANGDKLIEFPLGVTILFSYCIICLAFYEYKEPK